MINEVELILKKISDIHSKKNADYAGNNNQFENFERSAEIMSWFEYHQDMAFIWPISTKLARLATLLNTERKGGTKPKNEPIEDSFLDLATYCILWWAYYKRTHSASQANDLKGSDIPTGATLKLRCKSCGKNMINFDCFTLAGAYGGNKYFCSIQCLFSYLGITGTVKLPISYVK